MTFDKQQRLGRNLTQIGKELGLEREISSAGTGDLGSLYLSTDHYRDAIREFRAALDRTGWDSEATDTRHREIREKLAWCYFWTGDHDEAAKLIADIGPSAEGRAGRLLLQGRLALEQGDPRLAKSRAEEALVSARESEALDWTSQALSLLGIIAQRRGRTEAARDRFEEALHAYRTAGDSDGECRSYIHLGTLSKSECRWEEALRYLHRAQEKARDKGFLYLSAAAGLNLGNLKYRLGQHAEAIAEAREAEEVFREIGYSLGIVRALIAQSRVYLVRGDRDEIRRCLDEAGDIVSRTPFRREQAMLHIAEGEFALLQDDTDTAEIHFESSLELARNISPSSDLTVTATLHLTQLAIYSGKLPDARTMLSSVGSVSEAIGDPALTGWLERLEAEAALAAGDIPRGEEYIEKAITHFERIGYRHELAQALTTAGKIATTAEAEYGQTDRVLTHLLRAKRIWEDLSVNRETGLVSAEIAEYWLIKNDLDEALSYARTADALLGTEEVPRSGKASDILVKIEERFSRRMLGRAESPSHIASFVGEELSASLGRVLRHAAEETGSARAWVATGANGAELEVVATHGIDEVESDDIIARVIAMDPAVLEMERPVFCSGLPHTGAGDDTSVVLYPFAVTGNQRGLLYVDRIGNSKDAFFRVREVEILAGTAHTISHLISESQKNELRRENLYLREKLENRFPFANIVTGDPKMIETMDVASRVAEYPITVLIEGETGTGKQLLARAIHDTSDRAERAFTTVNCASLPAEILESELFGYVQGAFTGALTDRNGLFQEADGGTIFLDEIGKAGAHVQRSLLHVLDQGIIRPVGSNSHRKVDVRVICATSNMQLKEDIDHGRFLKDLYYRINDISLRLPPLRERLNDVRLLADYFLDTFRQKVGRPDVDLTPEVYSVLERYEWPGNVRELEKAIQRAVLLAEGDRIDGSSLPEEILGTRSGHGIEQVLRPVNLKAEVEDLERERITEVLALHDGNRSRTARDLGLSLRGLRNKIRRYGLE